MGLRVQRAKCMAQNAVFKLNGLRFTVYLCMCVWYMVYGVWCRVPKMFGQWINDSTSPTDDQVLSLALVD